MIFEKKILAMYKNLAFRRCDDKGTAFYFSSEDFEGMNREEYPFRSSLGHELRGFIYYYDNPIEDRLIVFEHGFFGGHRSYMREIEMLCRRGYTVFAYDHTGCMESGGKDTNGMAQSLCDLNDCLNTIKNDSRFAGRKIDVMGHSWGAYSTMNIPAFHPGISHIVALSGFVSVKLLIRSLFGGPLAFYRRAVMKLEKKVNPRFFDMNAAETLASSSVKALLIYSDNDVLCKKTTHYDALEKKLSGKENVELLLVSGKGHNPNYTEEAVKYLNEYSAESSRLTKAKKLSTKEEKEEFKSSFDWFKMTDQDMTVWEKIFAFLER